MAKAPLMAPPPTAAPPVAKPPEKQTASSIANKFKPPSKTIAPQKIMLLAVEGWGKTTIGASIPNTAILMPETETGYNTLYAKGRVPKRDAQVTTTWKETLDALDTLKGYDALTLDELSGFETQCFEHIRKTEKNLNTWEKFDNYGKGARNAAKGEWKKFLAKLESLNIMIMALCHCEVGHFDGVDTEGYSLYTASLNKKIWHGCKRWANAVFFGTFDVIADDGKVMSNDADRVLYTEHRPTHPAKNQYGMKTEIQMGKDPAAMWDIIHSAMGI